MIDVRRNVCLGACRIYFLEWDGCCEFFLTQRLARGFGFLDFHCHCSVRFFLECLLFYLSGI